jgi:hypothetical protein
MVDLTNVNDVNFPDDWVRNNDYLRDVNSHEAALRLHCREHWGAFAVINEGLLVQNGTNPDTFLITAGLARDMDKYPIVVPINVDNVACVDATGGWNYVAVRHPWAYSGDDAAVKTGVGYNRIRSDAYEVNVAGVQQVEAAGWVLLCRAYKSGGIWYYVYEQPYRSRFGQFGLLNWTYVYAGIVPVGPNLMSHQGAALELWTTPVDVALVKMTITAAVAAVVNSTVATARVGGAATTLAVTLPGGLTGPVTSYLQGGVTALIDQIVHVEIGCALGGGPTNVGVSLTGYILRGLA